MAATLSLLQRTITRAQERGQTLTLGFRDLEEMTDADLRSVLEDLVEMGMVDPADLATWHAPRNARAEGRDTEKGKTE